MVQTWSDQHADQFFLITNSFSFGQLVWYLSLIGSSMMYQLLLLLVAVAVGDALVWSLVLGNPVVDMDQDQLETSSYESDMPHPRNTKRITSSRPTRHHHGQANDTFFLSDSSRLLGLLTLFSTEKLNNSDLKCKKIKLLTNSGLEN